MSKPIDIPEPTEQVSQIDLVSPTFTPTESQVGTPVAIPVTEEESGAPALKLSATLPEVECLVRARIPTTNGTEIFLHLYTNNVDKKEHLAIVFGNHIRSKSLDRPREGETEMDRMTRGAYTGRLFPGRQSSKEGVPSSRTPEPSSEASEPTTLVRIHSECYTGETAWSARCDCGEQLDEAARLMGNKNSGVIVYLRQEGRGIGLGEKLKAYNLQDLGADTVQANLMLKHPADGRDFGLATAILQDLDQTKIQLLTNNPDKIAAVEGPNKEVTVVERVPMVPLAWKDKSKGIHSDEVDGYLRTKIERMGHLLSEPMAK